jgi:hypothetical protein
MASKQYTFGEKVSGYVVEEFYLVCRKDDNINSNHFQIVDKSELVPYPKKVPVRVEYFVDGSKAIGVALEKGSKRDLTRALDSWPTFALRATVFFGSGRGNTVQLAAAASDNTAKETRAARSAIIQQPTTTQRSEDVFLNFNDLFWNECCISVNLDSEEF